MVALLVVAVLLAIFLATLHRYMKHNQEVMCKPGRPCVVEHCASCGGQKERL